MQVFKARLRIQVQFLLWLLLWQINILQANGQEYRSAVCRIYNQVGGQQSVGSGTLIDCTSDGRRGLVLTCAHLFSEGAGEIVVDFPGVNSHGAKLVGIDRQADLAAVAIANPSLAAAALAREVSDHSQLSACGYGSNGQFRCATGTVLGQALAPGQTSLMIGKPVRSGDSGGGVFDRQGRLVAVVWDEAQQVTYASAGRPLQKFLDRMLGRQTTQMVNCPNGLCPLQRQPLGRHPTTPERNNQFLAEDSRWKNLQQQIDRLQREKQDRGDYLQRADLAGLVQHEQLRRLEAEQKQRHSSLLERLESLGRVGGANVGNSVGKLAVGWLGLSGPAGWGVLAATTFAGWWLGRRMRHRIGGAGGRRRRRFQS